MARKENSSESENEGSNAIGQLIRDHSDNLWAVK